VTVTVTTTVTVMTTITTITNDLTTTHETAFGDGQYRPEKN
jgi:hypothetical protein